MRPLVLHVDTLTRMSSASFSARTVSAMKPSGDSELDRLLWEATMDEVEAGFLSGPYPVEHLP